MKIHPDRFNDFNPVFRGCDYSQTIPSYTYSDAFRDHDIWLVNGGEAFISIRQSPEIRLVKGMALLIKPGDDYVFTGIPSNSFSLFFAHFNPVEGKSPDKDYFRELPFSFNLGPSRAEYFLNQFSLLREMQKRDANYTAMMGRGIMTAILSFMLEITFGQNCFSQKTFQHELVEKAIVYMKHNYCRSLTLDEIAKVVNLSPIYFGRVFRKITGMSPIQYLIKLRLAKARTLLSYPDLSLKEVSQEAGFSDVHYFTYLFSRNEKMPPGEYRRHMF